MAIAVVTGTSAGIGLATAATLARAGHIVHATMRDPKAGGEELREIAEREHLPFHIVALNVDSDESVRNAFAKILVEAGRIDVLVNSAGISVLSAVETPIAAFRAIMETNYFGAFRCIQAVLPGMRERRSGCIVNVTSVAGRLSVAQQTADSSSKFALEAASEVLAQEVKALGIRVAIIYEPFKVSLDNPVSPYVVGEKIREIVESSSWKIRHPVSPDSEGFLAWRALYP